MSENATTTNSARRYRVRHRRRPDPMSISSSRDFQFLQEQKVAAESVVDDPRLTLYCLDAERDEAVFVETDDDVDLSDFPFYYQGQFRHARGAVVMPMESMHAVAKSKGDAFERAVLIHSVGRCGSTLLSKMFGRAEQCLSLSEPDVYTQILADPFEPPAVEPLLESTTRLYYQPAAGRQPTHLVVKFRSFCIELAEAMQRATPNSTPVFLYRDIESVIRSGMRVFRYSGAPLWLIDELHKWVVTRPALSCALWWNRALGERLFPATKRFTSWEVSQMGPVGLLAIAWVSAMERCVQLQQAGLNMLAVRYDDLVGRTEETVAQLLEHCHLDGLAGDAMLDALAGDSQAGSVIERRRQMPYELSRRDLDVIREVLSRSDVIDSGDFEIRRSMCPTYT